MAISPSPTTKRFFAQTRKATRYPWLAESYKVADDKKSITFTLRKGVKFSDGSDLTADVVKWNLEQQLMSAGAGAPPAGAPAGAPPASGSRRGSSRWRSRRGSSRAGAPPAGAPAGAPPAGAPPAGGAPAGAAPQSKVKSIEVVDPNTVRVNLNTWDSSILASVADAQPGVYMVSKAAYDKNGQEWMISNPVGTGPFTLASYSMDGNAKLVKNPNLLGYGCTGQPAAVPGRDRCHLLGRQHD